MTRAVANLRNIRDGIRCDRASPLGNPYEMRDESQRAIVINAFRHYLYGIVLKGMEPTESAKKYGQQFGLEISPKWKASSYVKFMELIISIYELSDITLLCWCNPLPCHCDVYLKYFEWLDKQGWETDEPK